MNPRIFKDTRGHDLSTYLVDTDSLYKNEIEGKTYNFYRRAVNFFNLDAGVLVYDSTGYKGGMLLHTYPAPCILCEKDTRHWQNHSLTYYSKFSPLAAEILLKLTDKPNQIQFLKTGGAAWVKATRNQKAMPEILKSWPFFAAWRFSKWEREELTRPQRYADMVRFGYPENIGAFGPMLSRFGLVRQTAKEEESGWKNSGDSSPQ